eukprot:IDg18437t1
MGQCLSILSQVLDQKHGPQQQQHPPQQQHAAHTSPPNAPPGAQGGGGGPLSYAAAVAGGALHTIANQLESHGDGGGGGGGAAQAAAGTGSGAAVKPAAGVKFSIESAYVFKMPDGDTLSVDYIDSATSRKVTSRIRVMGIDCPETAQNFGQEAGDIGRALAFQTHVTLHVHTTDRYGRIVADVMTERGLEYGKEMLRKGAAWHYKAYDKRQELADLETEAREQRVGLWSYSRPVAPWDYRRRKREKQQQ